MIFWYNGMYRRYMYGYTRSYPFSYELKRSAQWPVVITCDRYVPEKTSSRLAGAGTKLAVTSFREFYTCNITRSIPSSAPDTVPGSANVDWDHNKKDPSLSMTGVHRKGSKIGQGDRSLWTVPSRLQQSSV